MASRGTPRAAGRAWASAAAAASAAPAAGTCTTTASSHLKYALKRSSSWTIRVAASVGTDGGRERISYVFVRIPRCGPAPDGAAFPLLAGGFRFPAFGG